MSNSDEIGKRIRPIALNMKEAKEEGLEEATIKLLDTLKRELNTLEHKGEISSDLNQFVYGMVKLKAF
jgi:hypothetical protein